MGRIMMALALAAAAGCAGQDWNADDNEVGYTKDPRMGAMTEHRDPVSGRTVQADTPWTMTHEGKTYYFADQASMNEFRRDPSKYTGGKSGDLPNRND